MTSTMTPLNRRHVSSCGLHASSVEKWDVVMWNDQVKSHSQEPTASTYAHHHGQSALQPMSGMSRPRIPPEQTGSFAGARPCFATSASAFGFGTQASRPRSITRRKSSHGPAVESLQVRHDALSALHRSVQQHDADFLVRMRELEQRCHLLPDSLSALRSEDLSGATRGRKRDSASWDEDGDVEMASWNERRRKHVSPWGAPSGLLGSDTPACDSDKTSAHSSDDEYVVATHEADTDSHSCSDDDEDDELDIVIVPGGSVHSSGSPPSLSTSLSSLPTRADSHSHAMHPYTPLSCIPTTKKDMDELAAAMAGGAGSVVEWSVYPDVSGNESHCANAEAGALWA